MAVKKSSFVEPKLDRQRQYQPMLLQLPLYSRLLQSSSWTKGANLDSADNVRGQVVPREVADQAACPGIVRAYYRAQQRLHLVETALQGKDVTFWWTALVARAHIGASWTEDSELERRRQMRLDTTYRHPLPHRRDIHYPRQIVRTCFSCVGIDRRL
jgi:hypothetical protein